ncbi:hypothetical protein ARAM_001720 [Aspergillus rambellii]|uniref:Clr5 domain-containing protein n=2 Tax=Aspergillus subgen. Nidulantes TaxID=2720870 RepID=A0A0F8U1B7_9EURO|nr:hypothetical protein ARAM_001720 [Aspergillus rambellii]
MKSAIPPDIWETKRLLITKLYKEEEWPLKQVIKLVQTRDFHPSESQLRSRLKKWQITKPSRKKYDGSRRLSGSKKNRAEQSHTDTRSFVMSSSRIYSSTRFSACGDHTRDQSSGVQAPVEIPGPSTSYTEVSQSPTGGYSHHSSPPREDLQANQAITTSLPYGTGNVETSPIPGTPTMYGMEWTPCSSDAVEPVLFFCPGDLSPPGFGAQNLVAAPYSPNSLMGGFPEPTPLPLVDQFETDYMGMHGDYSSEFQSAPYAHLFPLPNKERVEEVSPVMTDLLAPLLNGPSLPLPALHAQTPSPDDAYPQSCFTYAKDPPVHAFVTPLYQIT